MSDQSELKVLNEHYVDAFMSSDVHWFEDHLADEFLCIDSDGTLYDKRAFLRLTAAGPDALDYRLQQVSIRVYGDTAVVIAKGVWTRKSDHGRGFSRCTHAWVRTSGRWKTVAGQTTRTTDAP